MNRFLYIFIACVAFYLCSTNVVYAQAFELLPDLKRANLSTYLEFLEDPGNGLGIEDVRGVDGKGLSGWKKFSDSETGPGLGYGLSESAFWIRLRIQNKSQSPLTYFLQESNNFVDNIRVFIPRKGGGFRKIESGDEFVFSRRPFRHRTFVFKLTAPPGETSEIYIRYKNRAVVFVQLFAWSPETFMLFAEGEAALFWLFYGFILIMLIYNGFLYLSIRDRAYIYYVLYLVAVLISSMSNNGTAYQYLWPGSPWLATNAFPISSIGGLGLLVLFARRFMSVGDFYVRINRLMGYTGFALLGVAVFAGIFPERLPGSLNWFRTHHLYLLLSLLAHLSLTLLITVLTFILAYIKKSRPARYFFIAFFVGPLLGVLLVVLQEFVAIEIGELGYFSYYLGSTFQVVLLSLGLGDRINILKNNLQELNINLEEKVKTRTLQLEESNKQLRDLDRVKNNLFANISHELRTPLTLILSPLDNLLGESGGGSPEEEEALLNTMRGNAQRLLKLINDILELARFDAGSVFLNPAPVPVVALVRKLASNFDSLARDQKLEYTISDTGERILQLDEDKFEKIVLNLLSNAFKFTGSGHIRIHLNTSGAGFEMQVEDSGIGIHGEDQGRIFERFQQARSGPEGSTGGTGIGLSLCREIVQLHQGTIQVSSKPGQGSLFTVRLPDLRKVEGDVSRGQHRISPEERSHYANVLVDTISEKSPLSREKKGAGGLASAEAQTILIVEDNPDMRAYLLLLLQSEYQVLEASNGRLGLEAALEHQPDLILTDYMMPEMNGLSMLRSLKDNKISGNIPVILLTARAELEDRLEGLGTGADDYITKPFQARELQLKIKNLLQKNTVFELGLHKERDKIYSTLHDYLGGNLTDMSMVLARLKRAEILPDAQLEELEEVFRLTLESYKQCFAEAEELQALREDFLEGLHLIILRRYTNYSREFKLDLDESLKPLFFNHNNDEAKKGLYAVIHEIVTNDLKYGRGLTLWTLKSGANPGDVRLAMEAESIYPESGNNPGRGLKNIQSRMETVGGQIQSSLAKGIYRIEISLTLHI